MTVLAYVGALLTYQVGMWLGSLKEDRSMNLGWQDLIALAIVLAAAGYLARLAWGARDTQGRERLRFGVREVLGRKPVVADRSSRSAV